MPSSRQLRSIRQAIAADATPFDRLFATRAFKASFAGGFSHEKKSSRPPRGFDPTHARLDWLKLQAYFVWKPYSMREFSSAEFPKLVQRDFAQILKLNELLERAIAGRWVSDAKVASPRQRAAALLSKLDEVEAPRRPMDF